MYSPPLAVTGKIGGADSFNESSQANDSTTFPWTGTNAPTVSFWNYITTANVQGGYAFSVGDSSTSDSAKFSGAAPFSDKKVSAPCAGNSTRKLVKNAS